MVLLSLLSSLILLLHLGSFGGLSECRQDIRAAVDRGDVVRGVEEGDRRVAARLGVSRSSIVVSSSLKGASCVVEGSLKSKKLEQILPVALFCVASFDQLAELPFLDDLVRLGEVVEELLDGMLELALYLVWSGPGHKHILWHA